MNAQLTAGQAVYELFQRFGNEAYGEGCTQTSHAVQGGLLALEKGLDDELVIAAFLHDIGHLYPLSLDDTHEKMGDYGIQAHDKWGEQFLREYGFSERVIVPVANHAATKRYLCTISPKYFAELSPASIETMKYQGGLMNETEVKAFEQTSFYEESITIRYLDDEAKLIDFTVTEATLKMLCGMVDKHIVQQFS